MGDVDEILEKNIKHSLDILYKLVCREEKVSEEDENTAIECFVKLFISAPLSSHLKILTSLADLLQLSVSEDGMLMKCKICDMLSDLVIGNQTGVKERYGKWKEIITNELTCENVNIFKVVQVLIQVKISDIGINNSKISSCLRLMAMILDQNPFLLVCFKDIYGAEKLKTHLQQNVQMNCLVAEYLLEMLTIANHRYFPITQRVITFEHLAPSVIELLPTFDSDGQRYLCESLRVMCASVLQNRLICCNAGLIGKILDLLKEFYSYIAVEIKDCLISILEILGCLSISPLELKMLVGLFSKKNTNFTHSDRLVQCLERMASQNAFHSRFQPKCFIDLFDIYKTTYIQCPIIHKWTGRGLTIHCWVRFDFTLPNTIESRPSKVRHVLYSFMNALGEGFEAFFSEDGFLVIGVYTKKEFLTTTVTSSPFNDQEWHALTIVHTKKLLGKAIVGIFVDGHEIHTSNLQYPSLNKEICHSCIGFGVKSNPNFHYQIHPPSNISTRVSKDPLFPECIPAGKQNQVWGNPSSVKGQMASFLLFSESLLIDKIKELVSPGPNYNHLFAPKDQITNNRFQLDLSHLTSSIVFYYNAKVSNGDTITDLCSTYKDKSYTLKNLHARRQSISNIQETIQALGGATALFPLLEQACFRINKQKSDTLLDKKAITVESTEASNDYNQVNETDFVESQDSGKNNANNNNNNLENNHAKANESVEIQHVETTESFEKPVENRTAEETKNDDSSTEAKDIVDGSRKPVLSDIPVSYSPKKESNILSRSHTESIDKELSDISASYDSIDDSRRGSVNTFARSASSASVRNDPKRNVSSPSLGWTLVESQNPRTHSDIFKNWVRHDNHDLNGVAHFISLMRYMIASRNQTLDLSLQKDGISVIGMLLQDCDPGLINIGFLDSVAQLVESSLDIKDDLLESVYRDILFDFQIWYRADVSVQIAHVQLLHTYIKDDTDYFCNLFGFEFFFQTIERFYILYMGITDQEYRNCNMSESEKRDFRMALLGLVFYLLKQSPEVKTCRFVVNYMASVTKHEHLSEVLELLASNMKSSTTSSFPLLQFTVDCGCYILYRWLVHDIPDKLKKLILDIFFHVLQNPKIPDTLRERIMLKDELFLAIGELLSKQEISRDVVKSLLSLGLSLDRSKELDTAIYTDFNIVLSVMKVLQFQSRPTKLEMAIKVRNSLKLYTMSTQRCADQVGWYQPFWCLLLKENSLAGDMDVMEAELVEVVIEIIQLVIWHGMHGSDQSIWTRRCEPLCCLHEMSSRHTFILPSLVIERKLYESFLEASSKSLRESIQPYAVELQNCVQLLKLLEDFLLSEEIHGDDSQKWSLRLLGSIFKLLKAMNAWEDYVDGGAEWVEVLQGAERILYKAFDTQNKEIMEEANYRLGQLLHRRVVTEEEEACYEISNVIKVLTPLSEKGISCDNLLSVILDRMQKFSTSFIDKGLLVGVPSLKLPGVFSNHFMTYIKQDEAIPFLNYINDASKKFKQKIADNLPIEAGRLWMNALSKMAASSQALQDKLEASLMKFTKTIYCEFDECRSEEMKKITEFRNESRQKKAQVRKMWQYQKRFLMSERGAWGANSNAIRRFKLSNTENRFRMRLKLTENFKFNPHLDAARERDKAQIPDKLKQDVDENLLLVDVQETTMDEENDELEEEQEQEGASHLYELESFAQSTTSIVYSCECHLITLMDVIKGRIELSKTHIYFYDNQSESEGASSGDIIFDFCFLLEDMREIYSRRFNLRKTAMEFFLLDRSSFFVNFNTVKEKQTFYKKITSQKTRNLYYSGIRNPLKLLKESNLTNKWVNREVSNFEYIMQLNTISGRTYNDLAQYPVFPWILRDYTSDSIDINDPSIYRDLSKPIGAQNEEKAMEIKKKYENFSDESGLTKKSHYFTHYSNPGGVLHYLLRVEPFTSLHIQLQGGTFDWADRQFYSMATSWNAIMNGVDVKELIPEFFFFPEFLMNLNSFNLGRLQRSGEAIDNVILPPWCKDAYDFVNIHAQALESEYVSNHLNEWIDLIFGYKQRGDEAVKSLNVFSHYSYEGAVDLDKIEDPMLREAMEGMINNFGQTPTQLFKKAHPKRKSVREIDAGKPKVISLVEANLDPSFSLIEILHMTTPVIFIATCKPRLRSILYQAVPDSLLTVHSNGLFGIHSWLTHEDATPNTFTFTMDVLLATPSGHHQRLLPGIISPTVGYTSKLFAFTSDGHLMISCGYWDNTIRIISTDRGRDKLKACVDYHNDVVTCISLDIDGSHLISGSADFTCAIWKVVQNNGFCSNLSKEPIQILYGHDSRITAVAMLSDLDMAVSGAEDGTCLIHTIRKGIFVHSLKPCHPQFSEVPCTVVQIKLTEFGRIVILSKLANWEEQITFISVHSVNGALLGNIAPSSRVILDFCIVKDYIVIGCLDGTLQMRHVNRLYEVVLAKKVHSPIYTVAATHNGSHLFIGRGDGNILVVCPSTL